jgi:hypothetical protein
MTPPPELAKCANCDCWFAAAATDEVFLHATQRCRSPKTDAAGPFTDSSPRRNRLAK